MNAILNKSLTGLRRLGPTEPLAAQSTSKELSLATNGLQRKGEVAYAVELDEETRAPQTAQPANASYFHDKWSGADGSVLAVHHTGIGSGVTLFPPPEEDLTWLGATIAHEVDGAEPVLVPFLQAV
jgi:hypothetical protein